MNFLADELSQHINSIEIKISRNEQLCEADIKILLLNLLQIEDSHENE
jgi:hypothetical protein